MKMINNLFIYLVLISSFTLKFITNSKLEEVRSSIKELLYSYYMRGKYIQCNAAKDKIFSPEEATSQNLNILTSTSFISTVYHDFLGILIPYYISDLSDYANINDGNPEVYIVLNQNGDETPLEMKLYSEGEYDNYKYINNPTFKEIIQYLEVGDHIVYGGTGVIVYNKIEDENGEISDIIVIQSNTGDGYVKSKIEKNVVYYPSGELFSSYGFSLFLNSKNNENVIEEGLEEGTIELIKLSDTYTWSLIKNKKSINGKALVLRYLNEKDGQAILKYQNYYGYFENSKKLSDGDIIELNDKNKDRIKYRHLFIEKTVDKNNNNIVDKDESLTYKITIINQYNADYTDDLIVTEYLSNFVTYKSYKVSDNKIKIKKDNNKLTWNIGKLKEKEKIIIEYTVTVKSGGRRDVILSTGYVGNIPSSTVFNVIGTNLKKEQINLIKKNYDKLKNQYNGKTLINEIYKQSFKNVDIKFDEFNITDLIINNPLNSRNAGYLNLNEENPFYKAVLNNYWSSLAKLNYTFYEGGEEVNVYNLKEYNFFEPPDVIKKEDFIYKETFKTGDILIYTNYNDTEYIFSSIDQTLNKSNITYEEGEYSYIYIEGKGFVGVNYGDEGIPDTIHNRNIFNSSYYTNNNLTLYVHNKDTSFSEDFLETANYQTLFGKDYYVVLRPSLCFELPYDKMKERKSYGLIIFFLILGVILLLVIIYILWKYIRIKKSGLEFNLKNLKETPLLGEK